MLFGRYSHHEYLSFTNDGLACTDDSALCDWTYFANQRHAGIMTNNNWRESRLRIGQDRKRTTTRHSSRSSAGLSIDVTQRPRLGAEPSRNPQAHRIGSDWAELGQTNSEEKGREENLTCPNPETFSPFRFPWVIFLNLSRNQEVHLFAFSGPCGSGREWESTQGPDLHNPAGA